MSPDSRMRNVETLVVEEGDDGIRVDRWFKRHYPDLTHGRLEKLLRTGQIRIGGGRAKASRRLAAGDRVRVPPEAKTAVLGEAPKSSRRRPASAADIEALLGSILHKDDHLIALNKPPGLAVQGGTGTHRHVDQMLDALRFGAKDRPRLVHRLDKDTSGVLIVARTAFAAAKLTKAFRAREARKIYWAVVRGVPRPRDGRIDLALGKRAGRGGDKVVAGKGGKSAVTIYSTVETAAGEASWLALDPLTGRTHQLRVHCARLQTPIIGDGKYGGREAFLAAGEIAKTLHLHARAIRLPNPAGGRLEIQAPMPDHMKNTWRFFEFDEASEPDPFLRFEAWRFDE